MFVHLLDALRNIFGAGGGAVHPSVAAAAVYAMSVGQMMTERGASAEEVADAYRYAFGTGLGWSREETDHYWEMHADDPYAFTDESVEIYDDYLDWVHEHQPEINAATMRGDTFFVPKDH